jgi:hypothetical protein
MWKVAALLFLIGSAGAAPAGKNGRQYASEHLLANIIGLS